MNNGNSNSASSAFPPGSRYHHLKTDVWTGPDGERITYVRRRFCPHAEAIPALGLVAVAAGDRLDLITARALGDPTQFWRVADANQAVDPFQLTAVPGRALRIPIPQFPTQT